MGEGEVGGGVDAGWEWCGCRVGMWVGVRVRARNDTGGQKRRKAL